MASTSDELFIAIEAGDVGGVGTVLDADPSAGAARDGGGVSALMRALYRFDPDLVEIVKARAGAFDVFEAAALGDVDRLRSVLDDEPSRATAYSGEGFTAMHLAAFFGHTDAV